MNAPTDPRRNAALAEHADWLAAHDREPDPRPPSRARPLPPLAPEYAAPTPIEELLADRDALLEGYASVLFEVAALMLAKFDDAGIRARLEDVLVLTLAPAVLVDLRDTLNRVRTRCRELGIDPRSFVAPTRATRRAA